MLKKITTWLVVMLFASVAVAQDAPAVDLRPLWTEGQTARYQIEQTQTTTTELVGMQKAMEMTIKYAAQVAWEVTDASDEGGGTAAMTIEKMSISMSMMDRTIAADETGIVDGGDRAQPMADRIEAMVDSPLTVTVTADGKIDSVDGHEAIANKVENGDSLDEDYFKEIAMDLAALIGGQAGVNPGDTWTHRHESENEVGDVVYDATYRLAGVERIAEVPVALVDVNSEMTLTPRMPELPEMPANAPPVDVQAEVHETHSSGQVMFDLSRHEVVGAHFRQGFSLTVTTTIGERTLTRNMHRNSTGQLLRIEEK